MWLDLGPNITCKSGPMFWAVLSSYSDPEYE